MSLEAWPQVLSPGTCDAPGTQAGTPLGHGFGQRVSGHGL